MQQFRIDDIARRPRPVRPVPTSPPGRATTGTLLELQRAAGNQAVTALLQRRIATTTESYNATPMDGVTRLTALIGARTLGVRGTNPNAGEPTRINHVGALKGRYVGGHMLNQEMGGLGNWQNMIVQSENSNKNMNLHDNIIKRLSDTANRIETYNKTGFEYGVRERITVNAAAPDGSHNHLHEQHVPASLDVTLEPIKRPVGGGLEQAWPAVAYGEGHGETITGNYHIVNVPPYPPAVVASAPGISSRLADKARRERRAKRLKGRDAKALKTYHFKRVEGIGSAKARALRAFFKANPVALSNVVIPRGAGFNKADLQMLRYYGLR